MCSRSQHHVRTSLASRCSRELPTSSAGDPSNPTRSCEGLCQRLEERGFPDELTPRTHSSGTSTASLLMQPPASFRYSRSSDSHSLRELHVAYEVITELAVEVIVSLRHSKAHGKTSPTSRYMRPLASFRSDQSTHNPLPPKFGLC